MSNNIVVVQILYIIRKLCKEKWHRYCHNELQNIRAGMLFCTHLPTIFGSLVAYIDRDKSKLFLEENISIHTDQLHEQHNI